MVGVSGVLMGMQLRRADIDDFVIYEKESDVRGICLRNTCPGLHCGVPSCQAQIRSWVGK